MSEKKVLLNEVVFLRIYLWARNAIQRYRVNLFVAQNTIARYRVFKIFLISSL
jgi:hypothetical protein